MLRWAILLAALCAWGARASLFDSSDTATSGPATADASTTTAAATSTSTAAAEVAFLEVLETAQISSMSCLIALVNMTGTAIGSCLDLTTLAPLVVGSASGDFSGNLDAYLTTVCAETCGSDDIADAQAQLASQCADNTDTALVSVLDAILGNYGSAYRTLACDVTFNSTAALCLPSVLNTSSTADSYSFFDNLIGGTNVEQYYNSVFMSASCTGCMYEMYKACNNITTAMGSYLESTCINTTTDPNWADVADQQIPDALEISQSSATATTASNGARRRLVPPTVGASAAAAAFGVMVGVHAVDGNAGRMGGLRGLSLPAGLSVALALGLTVGLVGLPAS